jgi:hypothetical protein
VHVTSAGRLFHRRIQEVSNWGLKTAVKKHIANSTVLEQIFVEGLAHYCDGVVMTTGTTTPVLLCRARSRAKIGHSRHPS